MRLRNLATVYVFDEDRVLLMYRTGSRVFGGSLWVGIGGHFEQNEINEPIKCVIRELFEETGITVNDISELELKYVTIRKANDEIRQQYIYFTKLSNKNVKLIPCGEGELAWIQTSDIPNLKMSFTNSACIKHYFGSSYNAANVYVAVVNVTEGQPTMEFTPMKDFDTNY